LTGYTRQSAADIVPTAVVRAAPINNEFNALRDAFALASGHRHDGTAAEGHLVPLISDDNGYNKVVTDSTNNRIGLFVNVSSVAVEQVRFQSNLIVPVTTNTVDIGSSTYKFKNLVLSGTATLPVANIGAGTITATDLTVTGTIDVTNTVISNVSTPTLSTDAANKSYVDTAISNLINGAPGTIDTLNEIAVALGNDANFSTTMTNSLAAKLSLSGGTMTGNIAMGSYKITGLGTPTTGSDATTKTYVDGILGSATSAAASAAAAAVSETNAAASYDSFDDRYLGPKASNPTVDNDGNTLLTGAIYFNTVSNEMRAWSGSAWVAAYTGSISLTSSVTGVLPLANGGTNAASAPAAMASLMGFTSTATAGTTTTLTNASSYYQVFTGTAAQTIQLPVTSTLGTGWTYHICNNSTGTLTVNSSGANAVISVPSGITAMVTCIGTTLTTAADWEAGLTDFSTATGTGSVVLGTNPTIATPNITTGLTIAGAAGTAGQALLSAGAGAAPTWGTAGVSAGKAIAFAMVMGF
jgi:hypothetical protein